MPYVGLLLAAAAAAGAPCAKASTVTDAVVQEAIGHRPKEDDRLVSGVMQTEEQGMEATVFMRSGAHWQAYPIDDTQEIVGGAEGPGGVQLLFAFHTAEGPGDEFRGLLLDRSGRVLACPSLAFPNAVQQDLEADDGVLGYVEMGRVVLGPKGRGYAMANALVGPSGHRRHAIYRYDSVDGGKTWSAPRLVKTRRKAKR